MILLSFLLRLVGKISHSVLHSPPPFQERAETSVTL